MCQWCRMVQEILGLSYFCRPCWRRMYRNKRRK